jgi:hypothetical protein
LDELHEARVQADQALELETARKNNLKSSKKGENRKGNRWKRIREEGRAREVWPAWANRVADQALGLGTARKECLKSWKRKGKEKRKERGTKNQQTGKKHREGT